MNRVFRFLFVSLLIAGLLPASVGLAKKGQGQSQGQGQPQGQSYGPPDYAGPKGQNASPYGPPSYAGPKTGTPGKGRTGDMVSPMGQGQGRMGQGQGQGQGQDMSKHKSKKNKKHGPPDHAPAWGYRNQQ